MQANNPCTPCVKKRTENQESRIYNLKSPTLLFLSICQISMISERPITISQIDQIQQLAFVSETPLRPIKNNASQ